MKSKQTALITGASQGIGLEIALEAAADGYDVVLVARSREKLEVLAADIEQKFPVSAHVIAQDLGAENSAQELFAKTKELGLTVDFLVNNAGYGLWGRFLDIDAAEDQQMLQLNMVTLTNLCRVFGKEMAERGQGKIMNVASTAAFQPGPLMATYYATKAYVLSLSEALASELADHGVTVTVLCPGPTKSGFQDKAAMHDSKLMKLGFMDAKSVAKIGYRGAKKNRTIVITGLMNRIMAFTTRLVPRAWTTRLSRFVAEAG